MGWKSPEGATSGAAGGFNIADWFGWGNYINGDTTPITLPAGVETKLTLDATAAGGDVNEGWMPVGVSTLWDSTNSQFDFSGLDVGDMVGIRLDGSLTTETLNDSFQVNFVGAVGSAGEFSLPFASGNRFIAATGAVSRYNEVFIGSQDMIDNPSEIRGIASDDASGYLIDLYIRVTRRGRT